MNESSRHPILVGFDGSDGAHDALALGKQLARATASPLFLAWIEPVGPFDLPWDVVLAPIQDRAEGALEEVATPLRASGYDVETRVGLLGSASQGIHEFAQSESADLVVVGSCHRGRVGQVLVGTVGARLLHGSPCPVAIAPRGLADKAFGLNRIGVAYDGSPEAKFALGWAERLARSTGAALRLFVIAEDASAEMAYIAAAARRHAEHVLVDGLDRVTGVHASGVVKSGLAEKQLAHHSQHVDMLVVGSRGYGPLRRVLLGSVSAHLVTHSKCALVVTPRAAVERREPAAPAGTVLA